MNTKEIIDRLKNGNDRFVNSKLKNDNQDENRRAMLISGQEPYAIILSCADSRVVPEMAFDTGLGELFVVRVAGNIANTSSIASIEYAVAHLNTKVIIVLGHESCGAVTAAVGGGDNGKNLNHLLAHINPAINKLGKGATIDSVIKENAILTNEELINQSEIIADAVKNGGVEIHSAYYHLSDGKVDFL